MNKSDLRDFLVERVNAHWQAGNNALLLAEIPNELIIKKGIDYREVLGEQRLKAFVSETSGLGAYRLVIHPIQKAKVGLVPFDADFEFPITRNDRPAEGDDQMLRSEYRKITLQFLKIISELSAEDQQLVNIPTWIIAKLISNK